MPADDAITLSWEETEIPEQLEHFLDSMRGYIVRLNGEDVELIGIGRDDDEVCLRFLTWNAPTESTIGAPRSLPISDVRSLHIY